MFPNIGSVSEKIEQQEPITSSKYRTGYKMDSSKYKDKDFFNILEGIFH
jgi:hypothetical protein